ncbi:MAG: flavodoxin family protein [Kiritimatiellia bacterium]|jgi:multimeric flavodoxin WrbA|nr:flavodoxin family protein [Kiritimatiellia bacterium]
MKKKTKQILILLGSAREDGNSTRLAYALADALSLKGHIVQSIRVPALEIAPCDGCGECWKPASTPCVIRDDMDSVYPMLRKADVIVFATPLHFFNWSAPLKTLVDRLYCLAPKRKHSLKGRAVMLLATAADTQPVAFAGLKATFRLVAGYMQWTVLGNLLISGVAQEGDIANKPRALARAQALAARVD